MQSSMPDIRFSGFSPLKGLFILVGSKGHKMKWCTYLKFHESPMHDIMQQHFIYFPDSANSLRCLLI